MFLGTPECALPPLRALYEAGHDIALVVTAPDRRRGRGGALTPTPVKREALSRGTPVTGRIGDVLGVGAELGVVVAFGRIIGKDVLAELPMVNLHFSLLPRWRGAAPVERAILAGDEQTGVCLMRVEEGLDTGGVYGCAVTGIDPHETADELRARLSAVGARLLEEKLVYGLSSLGDPVPQSGEATYAEKITAAERRIDWSDGAAQIERLVRIGRAYTYWRAKRVIVHRVSLDEDAREAGSPGLPGELRASKVCTGDGWLALREVQTEGRGAKCFAEWARGNRLEDGERLGPGG